MKKIFLLQIFVLLVVPMLYGQSCFDFSIEAKKGNGRVQNVDSVNYSTAGCIATFIPGGVFKSHMPEKYSIKDYLKKNNHKTYNRVVQINTSCQLYQEDRKNIQVFELAENSTLKSFDFSKEQDVQCSLLIITVYGDDKIEVIRIITSMKPISKNINL